MLDLKSCPFCGGAAELSVRGMTAVSHAADLKYYAVVNCPSCEASVCGEATADEDEAQPLAITAWNRRALQAVGPEPAVDYHGLLDDAAFWIEGALKCKEWNWSPDQFDAASDCLSSIRSALVSTPPAERVVEALREYADPRNWVVNGRFDPHSGNFDGTSFAVAALAAKDERAHRSRSSRPLRQGSREP